MLLKVIISKHSPKKKGTYSLGFFIFRQIIPMKALLYITALVSFFSCSTKTTHTEKSSLPEGYVEVITLDTKSPDACDFLLKLSTEDVYLFPIAMDNKFKIDKKTLYIKYRPSKIAQRNCKKGKPVILDDVIMP